MIFEVYFYPLPIQLNPWISTPTLNMYHHYSLTCCLLGKGFPQILKSIFWGVSTMVQWLVGGAT